jgi:hypothetical protein
MIQLIHCLECWKDKELEVFCGVELRKKNGGNKFAVILTAAL